MTIRLFLAGAVMVTDRGRDPGPAGVFSGLHQPGPDGQEWRF